MPRCHYQGPVVPPTQAAKLCAKRKTTETALRDASVSAKDIARAVWPQYSRQEARAPCQSRGNKHPTTSKQIQTFLYYLWQRRYDFISPSSIQHIFVLLLYYAILPELPVIGVSALSLAFTKHSGPQTIHHFLLIASFSLLNFTVQMTKSTRERLVLSPGLHSPSVDPSPVCLDAASAHPFSDSPGSVAKYKTSTKQSAAFLEMGISPDFLFVSTSLFIFYFCRGLLSSVLRVASRVFFVSPEEASLHMRKLVHLFTCCFPLPVSILFSFFGGY